MQLLPDEVEIQNIFNAIKKVEPSLNVPDIAEVELIESLNSYGKCVKYGGIQISIFNHRDRTVKNVRFVETVCHEVVHYNYYEYGHGQLFWDILNNLKKKVEVELCH